MLAIKNKSRKTISTAKKIIKAFDRFGKHRISSLTLDNGSIHKSRKVQAFVKKRCTYDLDPPVPV